jgi:hypothetical protein
MPGQSLSSGVRPGHSDCCGYGSRPRVNSVRRCQALQTIQVRVSPVLLATTDIGIKGRTIPLFLYLATVLVLVTVQRKMGGEDMATVFQLWEYNRAADGARR